MKTRISKSEMADWIKAIGHDGVMMSISEPRAKSQYLMLEEWHMEPIIDRIIQLASKFVFGKHKRFESLNGMVVCEPAHPRPHFHVVLQKPESKHYCEFKSKLTKLADRLCNEDFIFDLSTSRLPARMRKTLAKPCYERFVRVTDAHENTGSYLTKEYAHYYLLDGRKLAMQENQIDLFVELAPRH